MQNSQKSLSYLININSNIDVKYDVLDSFCSFVFKTLITICLKSIDAQSVVLVL